MRYQRVAWLQNSDEFPSVLYSEIDADGWEVRKVDEYRSGRLDLASASIQTGNTYLGEARVPRIEEINSDPQFSAIEIEAMEFEMKWGKAKEWFDLL